MLRPIVLSLAKDCTKIFPINHANFTTLSLKYSSFKTPEYGASNSFDDKMKGEKWQNENQSQSESNFESKAAPAATSEKCVNTVTLLGRVGNNPVLRGTESNPVVSFSLATSINYRPGGYNSGNDMVKKTEWHNIVVFLPNLRETAYNYITKGSRLMVQGRIMYGSIEDRQGTIRHTTSIVAEDIIRFAPSSNREQSA